MSIKAVVDGRILLEAMRLLADTDDQVGRIAERLGFSEVTNFIKFFRRMKGMTPAEFRQRYRSDKPSPERLTKTRLAAHASEKTRRSRKTVRGGFRAP